MLTIQHLLEIIPGEVDNDVELRVTWYRVTESHEGRRSRVDAKEEEDWLCADGACRDRHVNEARSEEDRLTKCEGLKPHHVE